MSSASDFIIENGVLKKYVGPGGDVIIPDGVTSIESHAFFGCRSLTCVTISDGVTSIGRYAFCGCSGLRSVMIPEGLTNIGDEAFRDCKGLADNDGFIIVKDILFGYCGPGGDVVIPDGVTSINRNAFYGCSGVTSVSIPNSVTSIPDSAFSGCESLMSVTIPDSVISIGSTPFSNFQSKLKTINASEAVYDLLWEELNSTQRFDVSCGCLKNGNVPKIVKQYIRKKKLRFFDAIANDDDVEAMAGFFSCLSQIPVGEIDDYIEKAASAIKIKSFLVDYKEKHFSREETENYFKDQTEKEIGIKERTLAEWRKIFRIDLGTRKAAYISGYYGKDSVVLIPAKVGNNPVLGVDNSAFRRKKDIQKIVIENGVRTIGSEAFNGCASLESVDIPASVNRIGKDVFKGTAVFKEKANWDKNVLYIENHLIKAKPALSGEYSIKEGTRSIAGGAFECCEKLTGVVLPDGVQTIGINAFSGCINLNTVYIPESVTEIFKSEGYGRFNFGSFIDCPNLTIHAPAGSYAEQYAKANNIPFVVE